MEVKVGKRVKVVDLMGGEKDEGIVSTYSKYGVVLENGSYYGNKTYSFLIEENISDESNLLERVDKKIKLLGEQVGLIEAEKIDDNEKTDNEKEDGIKNKKEKDSSQKDIENNDNEKGGSLVKTGTSIDPTVLPDDIKKAVVATGQMDEDQMNGVLADIGDAAVKALKRANVKDVEIYKVVVKIQESIQGILTKGNNNEKNYRNNK